MSLEAGPQFLKTKYELQKSPEVAAAIAKSENPEEQDPAKRIDAYLDRLENVLNPPELEGEGHEDFDRASRNLDLLKSALHKSFVIRSEDISESYWESQRDIARQKGSVGVEFGEEMMAEQADRIVTHQESSLDAWVDYLVSDNAHYPTWLRYYAIRGVLGMGTFNEETNRYSKRSRSTTTPFPEVDREALAHVLGAVQRYYTEQRFALEQDVRDIKPLIAEARQAKNYKLVETRKQQLTALEVKLNDLNHGVIDELSTDGLDVPQKSLNKADFAGLYVWAKEKAGRLISEADLEITEGEWVVFPKDSDPKALADAVFAYSTGWCVAGTAVAQSYLKEGDFHVYFSTPSEPGKPVPRVGIAFNDGEIAEVHGVGKQQNLDSRIGSVVEEKMREFPDSEGYQKKAFDMKLLTYVERKIKAGQELNKDDLIFLYEINAPIEGFGYRKDFRIAELRSQRDPNADASIVFECSPEEIAHTVSEITEHTKVYVGELQPLIFDALQLHDIEHIYVSFPEGKIERSSLAIGGKSTEVLKAELEAKGIETSNLARDMLGSPDFTVLSEQETVKLVRLPVGALGFTSNPTTDQLFARATELGLELCPAEVGPHQRLKDADQPTTLWYRIAMKPIADHIGYQYLFRLNREDNGLYLNCTPGHPSHTWDVGEQFLFRLRNVSQES